MQFPALDDTIIAVSTAWQASPLGVVRLSGSDSFGLVDRIGVTPPEAETRQQSWSQQRLQLGDGQSLPATAYWFRRPRSYTGQDMVELHTVGSRPLLRVLCGRLIELGARRALPGEFTARAFLAGKIGVAQADSVLDTIHAHSEAALRHSRRAHTGDAHRRSSELRERIVDLLALVEAGIDFVEEEDVHPIRPGELCAALDDLLSDLAELDERQRGEAHAGALRVALVGLPNVGKSTLFNRLAGCERAIVSPVIGTTRDVLSVEVEFGGTTVTLQDCAGLGQSESDLELAAHRAAEQAADQTDMVLWVHVAGSPWTAHETRAAARVAANRRLLVYSKADAVPSVSADPPQPADFEAGLAVSGATGEGVADLREEVGRRLERSGGAASGGLETAELRGASAALSRARELATVDLGSAAEALTAPELVALELREAAGRLGRLTEDRGVADVLDRIFSRFCVGK